MNLEEIEARRQQRYIFETVWKVLRFSSACFAFSDQTHLQEDSKVVKQSQRIFQLIKTRLIGNVKVAL